MADGKWHSLQLLGNLASCFPCFSRIEERMIRYEVPEEIEPEFPRFLRRLARYAIFFGQMPAPIEGQFAQ